MFLLSEKRLTPITKFGPEAPNSREGTSAERTRNFIKLHWQFSGEASVRQPGTGCKSKELWGPLQDLKDSLLTISGMAFQDAWTLELSRLKRCCVHVVTPHKKLIPFCAYYLTSQEGRRIYE